MRSLGLLLALLLTAATIGASSAADEPYDLYGILSLTGPAAFLGRGENTALLAAEKYVNARGGIKGRPVHMVVLDDQSNPQVAVQLANQVIAKKVPVLLGSSVGATCAAIAPLVDVNGPLMYCFSPVLREKRGSYALPYGLTNRDFIANGLRYMKAKGVKTIALLETTDATGQEAETATRDALAYPDLKSIRMVDTERYGPTDISITAQVSRIKAANPDGVVNYVTGTAFGTALRAFFESGYNGYIFASSSNAQKPQMQQYANFLPNNLIFGTLGFQMQGVLPPGVRLAKSTYLDTMHQLGVSDPDVGNIVPWDPTMLVIDGLRKYGTNATPAQLLGYIMSVNHWPGIQGMYDFTHGNLRGIDPKSTGAMRWDKAKDDFVIVSRPGGEPF
jgi:branched-chain amino acid transport system substrate-binding protein